ncbi:hypothetical protein Tco_1188991 [Tanacetum coccineum]
MPSSSSSAYKSKRYTIEELLERTHCDCPRPLRVKEQISWTKKNPRRRFKACPIYLKGKRRQVSKGVNDKDDSDKLLGKMKEDLTFVKSKLIVLTFVVVFFRKATIL